MVIIDESDGLMDLDEVGPFQSADACANGEAPPRPVGMDHMKTNLFESNRPEIDQWRRCDGEISQVVHRLRWRRRTTRIRTAALFVMLLVVSVGGSYFRSEIDAKLAIQATGSPCDHYMEEIRGFYCDRTQYELEPKLWEHIAHCRDCGRDFLFFGGIAHSGHPHVSKPNADSAHFGTAAPATASFEWILREGTLAAQH